jgi:hypothetical protein
MRPLLITLMLFIFSAQSRATDNPTPFIYLMEGDLFSYSGGEPFRETNWGHNHEPILSPDGRYIAYGSLPERLVELDAAGEYMIDYWMHPPTNIWVMEIATREFTRIAEQPAQPEVIDGELRYSFSKRSNPVWSPDARKIAWLEVTAYDEAGMTLVSYDMETGQTHRGVNHLVGANGDAGLWGMPNNLFWGKYLTYTGSNYEGENFLWILDGDSIVEQRLMENYYIEDEPKILSWRWVNYRAESYIALQYSDAWRLWDVLNNDTYSFEGQPFAQTILGLRVDMRRDASNRLKLDFYDGRQFILPETMARYAISPDTLSVAYMEQYEENGLYMSRLMLWENGTVRELDSGVGEPYYPEGGGLVWSPLYWEIEGEITLQE